MAHPSSDSLLLDILAKVSTAQKEQAEKATIENDALFNLILDLMQQKNRQLIQEELLKAVKQQGFDDIPSALNQVQSSFKRSPLQQAFQNQDFYSAKQLMDFGAIVGPAEKATFNFARDSEAAQKIGLPPPVTEEKLSPIKSFGLRLGVLATSESGEFSMWANIGPTYKLMTDTVSTYSGSKPGDQNIKAIADAFNFANKTAAYVNNTPKGMPAAGEQLAERIQSGKVTTIPTSCKGHAMALSVVPDKDGKSGYLTFTDCGGSVKPGEHGTKIYRIDDLSKITPQFINHMMSGHVKGYSHEQQMARLSEITGGKEPVHAISQKPQKYDNCSTHNCHVNVHGMLLCQKAIEKGGFNNLTDADLQSTKAEYKNFSHDMRKQAVEQLSKALTAAPKDPDLIKLAKGYLEQHPNAVSSLKEPLQKALANTEKLHNPSPTPTMSVYPS
ncbi:Dot/Icm T4SS effector AnkD/LegA15 [Legionella septentrionalis]|uniref:Dot/Icm T4SS effector AnkD/LegA15 n=1 Tax=Legionella septentrionalis TaxID=2498109 RepID=UPI000F8F5075|nr:Dot/Icm T4SS effector AnkD/LegA15 [Legionella septentrionalis]RUR08900.1 hypothetical protein ELY14_10415 [Legionella septentrionalis]